MKTRAELRAANRRDPEYWWVRVRAAQKPRAENRPAF